MIHNGRFGLAVALAFFAGFTGLWLFDRAPTPPDPSPIKTPVPAASEHIPYSEGEQHLLTKSVVGASAVEIAPTGYKPAPEAEPLIEPPASSPAFAPIARDGDGAREGDAKRVEIERGQPGPVIQPPRPDVQTQVVDERERVGRELQRRAEPAYRPRPEQPRPERPRDVHASSTGRGSRALP